MDYYNQLIRQQSKNSNIVKKKNRVQNFPNEYYLLGKPMVSKRFEKEKDLSRIHTLRVVAGGRGPKYFMTNLIQAVELSGVLAREEN